MAFIFYLFPPPPAPPTLCTRPAGAHACAHTALPSAPQGTPRLCVATSWGVPSPVPPPRLPHPHPPHLSGAATHFWPVTSLPPHPPKTRRQGSGQGGKVRGANSASAHRLCLPPPPPPPAGEGPILPLQSLFSCSAWPQREFLGSAKVGALKPPSQRSQPQTLLPRRDGYRSVPSSRLRILGVGKAYSGHFPSFPGPIRCRWPQPGARWGCPCPSGAPSDAARGLLKVTDLWTGPYGFSFSFPPAPCPPPQPCPSAPAVVVALPG